MNSTDWMIKRHSVRSYNGLPLTARQAQEIEQKIQAVNRESGQKFQLLVNEPKAFSGTMAKYGKFSHVVNYIALVGNDERKLGYYGEELVQYCTNLGLKTCWVGLTYKKEKNLINIPAGMKLYGVIAVGESDLNGNPHPMRSVTDLMADPNQQVPDWFTQGMEGVRLAPSAVNQQKYRFSLKDGKPTATAGLGFYTQMDLGIAQYHFDQASGHDWFRS